MYRRIGKRIFDLILAFVLLPVFLILIFILSLYVILIDGWPPFYITERLGYNKKPFKMLKIRSMKKNAEKILQKILQYEKIRGCWGKYKKLKPDPRLIKGGLFIRKHSLDELPQIFNILKGEMSFIGPRPYLQNELDKNFPEKIFTVKPGLTGLWQVSGRNNLTFEERIKLDLEYIENLSFWLDLKILILTIKELIFPKGAY